MKSKDIDILNIILIIISLYLAFHVPFGLFIFSYVFLGPLHYLTEINWLKEKKYFIEKANWSYFFIFLSFILTIPFVMQLPVFESIMKNESVKSYQTFLGLCADEIYLLALLFAIGLLFFKEKIRFILFLLISGTIAVIALNFFTTAALAIAIFVPTLIHVYIFTLLFMLYGNTKNKTKPGTISVILMLLVPFIILVSKINPIDYQQVSDYTKTTYMASNFKFLNREVSKWFLTNQDEKFTILSVIGIKIQIFVAFAYTYHYLNWFSKTSIVRWDKAMNKSKIITILTIWICSVALYLYNFKIGFIVLSFISIIHVLLEFPLNITTIKALLRKITVPVISKN